MTLIAVFSDKGSPGVTTTTLALASVWPRRVAVVELDGAGGDLALRLTDATGRPVLATEPSILTLAAAARRDPADDGSLLWRHAQPIPAAPDAYVIPGLSAPEQAAGMGDLWPHVVSAAKAVEGGDVIADLGRISDAGPAPMVAARAEVLIGVARAEPAAMLRLRDRMRHAFTTLPPASGRRAYVVLVAGDRRAEEAAATMARVLHDGAVAAQVAGTLLIDPVAVDTLHTGRTGPRLDRSLLLRSARAVAARIADEPAVVAPGPRTDRQPGRRGLLVRSR
jgi:hypothetical protein